MWPQHKEASPTETTRRLYWAGVLGREQQRATLAEENPWGIMGYPTYAKKDELFQPRKAGTEAVPGDGAAGQTLPGTAVRMQALLPSSP